MADDSEASCFSGQQLYFCRGTDSQFWEDRERIKTLIDLYEHYEVLRNNWSSEYRTS